MKYSQLANMWLDAHYKNGGFSPEDITHFVNSEADPMSLFLKTKDRTPVVNDYSAPAINADFSKTKQGGQYVLFSNSDSPLMNLVSSLDMSNEEKAGVLAHEIAHQDDPRINKGKMWSYPNKGYTSRYGLSGNVLQREAPAIEEEDAFWERR